MSTVKTSATIAKLAVAMVKAQAELKNPPKDSLNPHFKSKYADLATVRDTILPILNRHGLSVLQLPCECEDKPALTTLLLHDSGEFIETTMHLRPTKNDPQGVGSALTYARRYALQSIAGVAADEDDDGNAGSRHHEPERRPAAQQQPQRQPEPATPKSPPPAPSANGTPTPDPNAVWDFSDGTNKLANLTTSQVSAAIAECGNPPEKVWLKPAGADRSAAKTADAWGFRAAV